MFSYKEETEPSVFRHEYYTLDEISLGNTLMMQELLQIFLLRGKITHMSPAKQAGTLPLTHGEVELKHERFDPTVSEEGIKDQLTLSTQSGMNGVIEVIFKRYDGGTVVEYKYTDNDKHIDESQTTAAFIGAKLMLGHIKNAVR